MSSPLTNLIDVHNHLQDEAFAQDRQEVLRRAAEAGVRYHVVNGTCQADWGDVLELAEKHDGVIPFFGVHPWYVTARTASWLEELEGYLDKWPCGVGEIGLDRWVSDRDEVAQEEVFRAQLDLACRKGRPVVVHCLKAWGWLMDVLKSCRRLPSRILVHAYGGPAELVGPLAEMGVWFSFAGNVLRAGNRKGRQALEMVPKERLLVETDAPDMPPPKRFGRFMELRSDGRLRNEPANLPEIVCGIADIRGISPMKLADILEQNARVYFGSLIH